MTVEIYIITGVIIGIITVILTDKYSDMFDEPFDFEEFMMNNLGRVAIFVAAGLAWPVAILFGVCGLYWLYREREPRQEEL